MSCPNNHEKMFMMNHPQRLLDAFTEQRFLDLAARGLFAFARMWLVFRYWRRHWPPLMLCLCWSPGVIFLRHELSGLYVAVNITKLWLFSHVQLNLSK